MKDYPTLAIPLTDTERDTLHEYEDYLKTNLSIFFKVGHILIEIRNQKLYREEHRTFEAYCKAKWNIGKSRAYQLMDAADIQEELSTACGDDTPLPSTEAQTRALKKAPADLRPTVWTNAVQKADGQQPTAPQVTQTVLELTAPNPEPEPEQRQILHTVGPDMTVIKTEVIQKQPVTLLYHINHKWGVYVPDDIEISDHGELFAHSPYGEQFKAKASQEDIAELLRKRQQNPYTDLRLDWTCGDCGTHFNSETAFVYESGRERCWHCAETSDPCALCRFAHPHCDGCCDTCKHPCNGEQRCRLEVTPEPQQPHEEPKNEAQDLMTGNDSDEDQDKDEFSQEDFDELATMATYEMKMVFEAHGETCDLTITPGMVTCVIFALKRYGRL